MNTLDHYDQQMLAILAQEGRISASELARRIGLSKTPTLKRLKQLEQQGYILGYQARLNYELLGEAHIAFIQVTLANTSSKALREFNAAVSRMTAVEQCHMIAGNFDYLLKVRTRDIQSYRQLLGEQLANLPHVAHTSTFVSMETVCDSDGRANRDITSTQKNA
ncbi:MAG: Lrp/AsnC ligand binding domain-containing protein [Thiothrix sp.]|nr:Lrp/AsnC ligand binding domain-containing protein [Thiothrix sp.]HPQ97057.1 Lrp/AsnC ligand binding domain-containing protein [Thiolinea sp.]